MNELSPSTAQILPLINIIFIDLVLAGDNAVVVGMAASRVSPELRTKVIVCGLGGAVIIRIGLALLATHLLTFVGLTLAGGILLLWVCWKMYREIAVAPLHQAKADLANSYGLESGFRTALMTIILADLSMSLDNVLAVAGVAKGDSLLLILGLTVSIAAMAVAANYIARMLTRFSWIMWVGLMIILYVALDMIYRGGSEVFCDMLPNINCKIALTDLIKISVGL